MYISVYISRRPESQKVDAQKAVNKLGLPPGTLTGHLGGRDTCHLERENGLMRRALRGAHGLDGGALASPP